MMLPIMLISHQEISHITVKKQGASNQPQYPKALQSYVCNLTVYNFKISDNYGYINKTINGWDYKKIRHKRRKDQ